MTRMNRKRNGREAVAPAKRKSYARSVAVAGTGVVLALTEFLCLPALMPKPVTFPRAIHGELISPPAETNSITTAIASPARPARSSVKMTGPPGGHTANFSSNQTVDGYLQIGFDKLADFQVFVLHQVTDPIRFTSVPKLSRPIPDFIKSLDNHEVAVQGFMLPLKFENTRVTEFLLMRSRSFCCFGVPLQINEWIHVRMKGDGVRSIMDVPLTVYGTLHVGEIIKNGQLSCIYKLDGEKMDEPVNVR
jgi:hypothetical protein